MSLKKYLRSYSGRIFFLIFLFLFLVASAVLALSFGVMKISVSEIIQTLFFCREGENYLVLYSVRLPRIVLGILVGASLGVSGAILQGVMRNPLASPGIIGISAGGGLAGIIAIIFFSAFSYLLVPFAFSGALATALLIYLLAWKKGVDPVRLILAGVAVAAMLGAFSSTILIMNPEKVAGTLDFAIGTLSGRGWDHVRMIFPYTLIGLGVMFFFGNRLNVLALGDDIATGLGLKVERTRLILISGAALLAAAAVSVAGLLGFVGLIAPHMIRMVIGSDNRYLLPASALFGAVMVVFCDTAGRLLAMPSEIPAGIVMALLGPPFFLFLLRRYDYET